jgi:hypothetical protein
MLTRWEATGIHIMYVGITHWKNNLENFLALFCKFELVWTLRFIKITLRNLPERKPGTCIPGNCRKMLLIATFLLVKYWKPF